MAPRNLTEVIDNLYVTTWQNMKGKAADQIFDATPFYYWMRANGAFRSEDGGRFIEEPLRIAKSDNVRWVRRGSTMPLGDKQFLDAAIYEWRYVADSVVRFGIDDLQNRGRKAIMNLAKSKLANSQDTLIDTLETRMAGTAGTDQMNGLLDVIPDDPTASAATLGQIDPSVYTWWRNQTKDMTGLSFATYGVSEMNTMMNNCSNNMRQDAPSIIVCGQTPYEMYWEETLDQRRVVNKKLGDAGFETVDFRGTPLVWSPAIANTRMYFINHRFLNIVYDPAAFFDMTAWKSIPDQINDRAAQILVALNMTTGRRRVHGVMHTIDTA